MREITFDSVESAPPIDRQSESSGARVPPYFRTFLSVGNS
jgi:hypothetical protein